MKYEFTSTNKKTGEKMKLDGTGLLVFLFSFVISPVFLVVWGFGWASGTLLAVALTGFLHYMVLNVVDQMKQEKK